MLSTRVRGGTERPTYQWEPARGLGALHLRLFGALGACDLERVRNALQERCRSPRDLVCVDFQDVEHLDYRALPEFTASIQRQRERGASVWFTGMSVYLRALFQVAGQGPAVARLEWRVDETGPDAGVGHAAPWRGRPGRVLGWDRMGT